MIVSSTAISQAGKRDELLSRVPSEEGNEQIQWIWTGMLIELEQYVVVGSTVFSSPLCVFRHALWSDIRVLGRKPSAEDQARVQDRQESLQSRIEAFHQQALQLAQPDAASKIRSSLDRSHVTPDVDLEESDEETFFLDTEPRWEEEGDVEVPAEQLGLWLPSSFTKPERAQLGLKQVAEIETELREGQANNALETLQSALAEKSLRFRTEVKPAKSQKTATRAWDSIHKADKQIRGAVSGRTSAVT